MNEKFYALSKEKQSQILNAAYKVFAMNQYKKAPTSEIAAEAGISKSLLFHYFYNKQELYIFLWNHAADLTKKYMCKYKVCETDVFFEMMRRGLMAKCAVMRKYTFLSLFSINSYFETEPDIQSIIQPDVQNAAQTTLGNSLRKEQSHYIRYIHGKHFLGLVQEGAQRRNMDRSLCER